jgi:hypothetical protein
VARPLRRRGRLRCGAQWSYLRGGQHRFDVAQRGLEPFCGAGRSNPQDFAEAYAVTAIPSGLQQNSSFNITFWVSDGTTTQTESVVLS